MSTLLDESLEMNMTYLLPFLCILYVLLPRKTKTIPITNSFKIKDTLSNVNNIDKVNDVSNVLVKAVANGTGITLLGDHTDDSHDHFQSSTRLKEREKGLKTKESMVPGYMMDLYKRLSRNTLGLSNSNTVRSLRNSEFQGTGATLKTGENNDYTKGTKSQANVLTFNISSISKREVVNLAELRVYTSIELDKHAYYFGVDREVSLYDVIAEDDASKMYYNLITSRRLYECLSDWEIFNVTSAVQRWLKSGNSIHKIEIRLENVWWGFSFGSLEFKTFPNDKYEPLLLVYSNDNSKHKEHTDERRELISHEYSSQSSSRDDESMERRHYKPSDIYLENASEKRLSRQKRAKKFRRTSACRRRPMFVDFEAINWHTWIIAPRGYQVNQPFSKVVSSRTTPLKI